MSCLGKHKWLCHCVSPCPEQNQHPGTLRIPGLETPPCSELHIFCLNYISASWGSCQMSVCEWIPQKLELNSRGLFIADTHLMSKSNLGKSGQPLKHSTPCASYQGSSYWDSWLSVGNSTFPHIFKYEDEKCCVTTVKGKTFSCQTSGMWCFAAQRGTLWCLLFATPALFFRHLDLYLPKKSFMPGLMLISPDSSINGALCWSIAI